ncbi:hypothetical protein Trydic_g3925 [Trypoxylus dichotomus]
MPFYKCLSELCQLIYEGDNTAEANLFTTQSMCSVQLRRRKRGGVTLKSVEEIKRFGEFMAYDHAPAVELLSARADNGTTTSHIFGRKGDYSGDF